MRKMTKTIPVLALLAIAMGGITSCGPKGASETIRIGLQGNLGSGAGFSADRQGYWTAEELEYTTLIDTGPNLISSLKNGALDVAFLGNGVAWNYFTEDNLVFLTIDNLTNDDRLIASPNGKGKDLTLESSEADLKAALAGSTVALELGATPGTFLKSLVNQLNSSVTNDSEKLWFIDTGATKPNYPAGLKEYNESMKITINNTTNANLTSIMTASTGEIPDFCVAFAPISTNIEKLEGFDTVATSVTHLADTLTPSTWCVRKSYLEEYEDVVQKFMNGLAKGMDYRHSNIQGCINDTAAAVRQDASSFSGDIAQWPSAEQLATWATDGTQLKYFENIYKSQTNEAMVKDYKDTSTYNLELIKNAYNNIK